MALMIVEPSTEGSLRSDQGGHGRDPEIKEIILFIDELHTIVGAAQQREPWTHRTLSSRLWRGELRVSRYNDERVS